LKKIDMKFIITSIALLVLLQTASAQVSDSTVKVFSDYICNCVDTFELKRPEADLRKDFMLCKTLSLTNLLNLELITPELLTDEKTSGDLEKRAFARLSASCDGIKRLITAFNKNPVFEETNADNLFIPAAYFKTFSLLPGQTDTRMHIYNNLKKGNQKFQRVVDIRWTFTTEAGALKWHQSQLEENSEGGTPIKEAMLVQGAQELKIYREGTESAAMMKAMGIGQRHHYFLFFYKNIACKIFVATNDKTDSKEAIPFVMAAVKQLRAVVK
jgi:hypothetical protein